MNNKKTTQWIIRCVRNNWKNLTARQMAGTLAIDPSSLGKTFRHETGITVKQFCDEKKMALLIRLLRQRATLTKTIPTELGFTRSETCYRWVKRKFGMGLRELSKLYAPP